MQPKLPVGFFQFTKNSFNNYQLNRWHSLGYARFDDIKEAGSKIKALDDNKTIFVSLAENAIQENRLENAAFYYRAAEFFTDPADKDKTILYKKFSETFFLAFKEDGIEKHLIPYQNSFLSAMYLEHHGTINKGTVLIHGGFDSFIEEFYCFWYLIAEAGYDVIAFDGPGQGATLHIYNLKHEHEWEIPVAAVLDYFKKQDVTLMGISFGGYWCIRAAAFEKRITKVIAFPPLYDLLEQKNHLLQKLVKSLMKQKKLMNYLIRMKMKSDLIKHVVNHCLNITGKKEPYDVADWLLKMNKENLYSSQITQDVLLVTGENDRFQPPVLMKKQKLALVNAKSVTDRVFTKKENAQNHCQMGNLKLAINTVTDWLNSKNNM